MMLNHNIGFVPKLIATRFPREMKFIDGYKYNARHCSSLYSIFGNAGAVYRAFSSHSILVYNYIYNDCLQILPRYLKKLSLKYI